MPRIASNNQGLAPAFSSWACLAVQWLSPLVSYSRGYVPNLTMPLLRKRWLRKKGKTHKHNLTIPGCASIDWAHSTQCGHASPHKYWPYLGCASCSTNNRPEAKKRRAKRAFFSGCFFSKHGKFLWSAGEFCKWLFLKKQIDFFIFCIQPRRTHSKHSSCLYVIDKKSDKGCA